MQLVEYGRVKIWFYYAFKTLSNRSSTEEKEVKSKYLVLLVQLGIEKVYWQNCKAKIM